MIAFEVRLNGKRICIAGAEDLAVLNTIISASGKLGPKTVPARPDDINGEVFYSVGGLTARPDPEQDARPGLPAPGLIIVVENRAGNPPVTIGPAPMKQLDHEPVQIEQK